MGGWKSQKTVGVKLDPATVKSAVQVFTNVMSGFNRHLASKELAPIEPIRPVGSVSYVDADLTEEPDKVYGDVDYLVSFPVEDVEDATSQRASENAAKRKYETEWVEYLRTARPKAVDVEDTIKSTPLLVIIKLPDGRHVQVDVIVTFPKYQKWMSGRYTPERSRKGLVIGKLYKALGDILTMSIGTEGVIARTRDGKRVSSGMRKGVELTSVTTDIENFLVDIAQNIVGANDLKIHPILQQNPGLDTSNVSIKQFAKGILGLGYTLASHGVVESGELFAQQVAEQYTQLMQNELHNPKYKKASTPEQFAMIDKVKKQIESGIRDVDSVLRAPVQESILRKYVKLTLHEAEKREKEVLLRETIRRLLTEVAPEDISVDDARNVLKIFSGADNVVAVAVGELGKLAGSVGALTQILATGLKSFFSSSDYQGRYEEIFDNAERRYADIENNYSAAYEKMNKIWDEEGWKIPFMIDPGAFVAATAVKKSGQAALELLEALVGPKWAREKIQSRVKARRQSRLKRDRYQKDILDSFNRQGSVLAEQLNVSSDELVAVLSSDSFSDDVNRSPMGRRLRNNAEQVINKTVDGVVEMANEFQRARSVEDVKRIVGVDLEIPSGIESADEKAAADAALKYAKASAKRIAINSIKGHFEKEGLLKRPDGSESKAGWKLLSQAMRKINQIQV